jgi:Putative zinc-finger/Domain of unknown function (DUF4367)
MKSRPELFITTFPNGNEGDADMRAEDMHLSEGEIRAYLDHEMPASQSRRAEAHLAGCQACQTRAGEIDSRSSRMTEQFSRLQPAPPSTSNTALPEARRRLAERLEQEKEKQTMLPKTFNRLPRLVWVGIGVVAILAISMTFAPVRALANSFLALFRVEQIRIVQVDPASMPQKLESSSQLEYILSNNVKIDEQGETQHVGTADEAGNLAGFPVRLPTGLEGKQSFLVQPKASLTFTVNLELVRGVLKDIERSDIRLPDNLDGAVVSMQIPTSVVAQYGDCTYTELPAQIDPDNIPTVEPKLDNCTTLAQIPSPEISAPSDIDLSQIGEAYLQVLGMSQEEAASFASSVDWTTTFVIPLPRLGADYQQVDVNGIPGTLVIEHGGWTNRYMLLWVKDGIVYGLSGPGDKATALKIAQTIQ